MLLLIILLILFGGFGGGYYGWNNGLGPIGPGPAGGLVPLLVVILVVWLLIGRGGFR